MSGKVLRLDTPSTTLAFLQDGKNVYYLYYGKKIGEITPDTTFCECDNIGTDLRNKLFSCFGDDDHRDKSILLFKARRLPKAKRRYPACRRRRARKKR